MRPEHVRIQATERVYGERNLLHAQLNIISLIKRYDAYRAFRSSELMLKLALKNKLAEAKESLALLLSLLPKPQMLPKLPRPAHIHDAYHKRRFTLDQEVVDIQRRLAQLH